MASFALTTTLLSSEIFLVQISSWNLLFSLEIKPLVWFSRNKKNWETRWHMLSPRILVLWTAQIAGSNTTFLRSICVPVVQRNFAFGIGQNNENVLLASLKIHCKRHGLNMLSFVASDHFYIQCQCAVLGTDDMINCVPVWAQSAADEGVLDNFWLLVACIWWNQ